MEEINPCNYIFSLELTVFICEEEVFIIGI
jgi:hypothetical protein